MIQKKRDGQQNEQERIRRAAEDAPGLDRAGGVDREELDPRRSGAAPVEQNDRTRDRDLQEPAP